ncbi:putative reverse transcriptase domain-containing protein [Tanacetum coccineum]
MSRFGKISTVTQHLSRHFEDGSDIGSPGVDGPPIMPEDPYAIHNGCLSDSPGYVSESDPEEEPEEDDEDPEEDPADYLTDRDDDDDEDEDKDEDEEEEEEDHPAPADSVPHVHRMTARISIRDEPSISLLPGRVDRLLPLTTRTTSPLLHYHLLYQKDRQVRDTLPTLGKRVGIDLGPREPMSTAMGLEFWVDPREAVEEVHTDDPWKYHYETARLLDQEALVSREAWGCSIEVSYMTRSEILALRSVVIDYQRQVQLAEALKLLKGLQTQMVEFQRQHGPVEAMLCSLLSIMGYSQLADCIDLLFCLATQYRSFVQAMINEGVTAALAARDATRNGDDSHTSGTGARRLVQVARECTYPDFLKCQPLNFKGTKGVVGLTQWNPPNVNTRANQRVCFECGAQGHFKRDCLKLKNNNNRGTYGQRLSYEPSPHLGELRFFCKRRKMGPFPNVHRLQGIEQPDSRRSDTQHPRIDDLFDSAARIDYVIQRSSEVRASPVEGSREDIPRLHSGLDTVHYNSKSMSLVCTNAPARVHDLNEPGV